MTEQELSDTNEQLSDLTCQNQSIAGAKRKLETEMQTLAGDMDEMASEASLSEDKAKKAMVDAARLAEELRQEQDLAQMFEKDRKLLECQLKDALPFTSDSVFEGRSRSALGSLEAEVLLLFRASSFICRLTAMALYACLHRDLAKFFFSCSETVAWMFLSDCLPVIHLCSRAEWQVSLVSTLTHMSDRMKSFASSLMSSQ